MKTKIGSSISRTFYGAGLKLKKCSPEILIVTGVAGFITTTILACKASMHLEEVLDDSKTQLDEINEGKDALNEEEAASETKSVRIHTGLEIAKLYSPAIATGVGSVVCIFASNSIMRKRTAAIAAAYTALDQGFKQYRRRVVDQYGEEIDRSLLYGTHKEEITEEITDENGKTKKVKNEVEVIDPESGDPYSPYARFFDESCKEYTREPEYNLKYVLDTQRLANDWLVSRGFLFLNDVYDELGIQKTDAGQHVGWIYDKENPTGDNYVDFGIHEAKRQKNRDFVNGYESVILLDFNVDGDIIDAARSRGLLGKV